LKETIDAELTGAKIIQYIIGAYKRTPSESVNVLEIEPIGVYGYNTDGGKDIIKTWYGLPKTSSVTVNVTSMSINAFAGLNLNYLCSGKFSIYSLIVLSKCLSFVICCTILNITFLGITWIHIT